MKTKVRRIENSELKNPTPLLSPGAPNNALTTDMIKNISAARIPAFKTNEKGESTLVFRNR